MAIFHSLTAAIEVALNRVLETDPHSVEQLKRLDGRSLDLTFREIDQTVRFRIADRRFTAESVSDEAADVRFIGSMPSFARIAIDPGLKGAGLASAGIEVHGNAELAQELSQIIEAVEFDIEEPLARVLGASTAHQVGRVVRDLFGFGKQASSAVGQDALTWLREGTGDLVHRDDVEVWMDGVDHIAMAVDRLEARLRALGSGVSEQQ